MECSWDQLVKQLKLAENLDEVIEAHNLFLETLIKRALLDERSRDILTQLRAIYDRIVEFSNIQVICCAFCSYSCSSCLTITYTDSACIVVLKMLLKVATLSNISVP